MVQKFGNIPNFLLSIRDFSSDVSNMKCLVYYYTLFISKKFESCLNKIDQVLPRNVIKMIKLLNSYHLLHLDKLFHNYDVLLYDTRTFLICV